MVTKIITKIRNVYRNLVRPIRNLLLEKYMDKVVIVFKSVKCENGGIYQAIDYSGLDNTIRVNPVGSEDSAFDVPIYVKPHEVFLYSLDKKEFRKLMVLNFIAQFMGRI